MLWAGISVRARCTTLCDKVCQWLAASRWFSPCTPVSSSNKTDCHDITEILLKVALNTIKQTNKQTLTNSFVSYSWNVVTKGSSLNEPPYWILKIQLVNYYNMIENKDTVYLWNNFLLDFILKWSVKCCENFQMTSQLSMTFMSQSCRQYLLTF